MCGTSSQGVMTWVTPVNWIYSSQISTKHQSSTLSRSTRNILSTIFISAMISCSIISIRIWRTWEWITKWRIKWRAWGYKWWCQGASRELLAIDSEHAHSSTRSSCRRLSTIARIYWTKPSVFPLEMASVALAMIQKTMMSSSRRIAMYQSIKCQLDSWTCSSFIHNWDFLSRRRNLTYRALMVLPTRLNQSQPIVNPSSLPSWRNSVAGDI